MEKIKFESYKRVNGHDEFYEWLRTLPIKDRAKLLSVVNKTEKEGLLVAQNQKWVKKIEKNLYELRSKVSTNIQRAFYFHAEGNLFIITHGFTKKDQKTPTREIKHAIEIREEWRKVHENQ